MRRKNMKRKFKTIEEWKEHLKRDKTKEYEKWKKRNNIQSMGRSAVGEMVVEGELIKKK